MRRRTEITVDMDRWVVVTRARRIAWCPRCGRRMEMLSVDDAAILARVNSRTIFHLAESGALHAGETPEGLLVICPNSLLSLECGGEAPL